MGDIGAEPSMEDILSSIKRIIAEEDDVGSTRKRAAPRAVESESVPDVLELSEAVPAPRPEPAPAPRAAAALEPAADPIVSAEAEKASRGALDHLSRMIVKSGPESDGTLEGLVREMLRPMLRDWLDAHLPAIVEAIVAREVERITARR